MTARCLSNHRRLSIDPLAFAMGDLEELAAWQARFEEIGVRHSPIEETDFGSVLSFRDSDGIQLELFHMPG